VLLLRDALGDVVGADSRLSEWDDLVAAATLRDHCRQAEEVSLGTGSTMRCGHEVMVSHEKSPVIKELLLILSPTNNPAFWGGGLLDNVELRRNTAAPLC
jgi:hypothetical protein